MASTQDLLLQLEGQKSPFTNLLEGFATGVGTAQDKALENAKALILLDQQRQKMIQQQQAQQAWNQMEAQTQNNLKKTSGVPSPFPAQKLEKKTVLHKDESGNISSDITLEPPKTPTYDLKNYTDRASGETRIGKVNKETGELIMSPTDPLAEKQPVTPEERATAALQAKLAKEKPKASGALDNTLREYDNMIKEALAVKNDPSLSSATGMLMPLTHIPGTGAKRVHARLETLKAKTLLNVLSSLKQLSTTGASGFGQLSNVEGEQIRNSVSTLDPSQSTKDLQDSLDRFVAEMQSRKENLKNTFNDTYGGGSPAGGGSGAGQPKKIGRFLVQEG